MTRPDQIKVGSAYGAPMGRHTHPYDGESGPLRLFRVPIDRGGYDQGGAYWGLGPPLYCVMDTEGDSHFFRASSRDAAKAKVRETWPDARFCR